MKDNSPASGLVEIDLIVWEFLGNIKAGEERYEDFLGYALDFYSEELNNHGFIGVKNKVIDLTAYKTFKLPKDCIDWIAIAVQVGMRLRRLVKDDSIAWNFKDLNEQGMLDVIVKSDQEKMNLYTMETNAQGEDVGQNFHLSEKHDLMGYFTENKDSREITIHPVNVTVSQVVLRYISDCYNKKEKTLIPATAKKVMKSYIDWKDHEYNTADKKIRLSPWKKTLYDSAYEEYLAMNNDLTTDDIREMLYDAFSLIPTLT